MAMSYKNEAKAISLQQICLIPEVCFVKKGKNNSSFREVNTSSACVSLLFFITAERR
uniref:Uncharacterized protein n=1 Tax=Anguilla anguilla TaxID=7936 RepID=A0A0E9WPS0_ANGAN